MSNVSPLSKIFPRLGIHNRTCQELTFKYRYQRTGESNPRWRDAQPTAKSHQIVIPSVIEPFMVTNRSKERVWIASRIECSEFNFSTPEVVGIDANSNLGKAYRNFAENRKAASVLINIHRASAENGPRIFIVTFRINLDSGVFGVCDEKGNFAASELAKLCERTKNVAFEFIAAYRKLIRIAEWFSNQDNSWELPNKDQFLDTIPHCNLAENGCSLANMDDTETRFMDRLRGDHPVESDVRRLLCSYKSIRESFQIARERIKEPASEYREYDLPRQHEIGYWLNLQRENHPVFNEVKSIWQDEKRVNFDDFVAPKIWEYYLAEKC